jgi:hypothetical protein
MKLVKRSRTTASRANRGKSVNKSIAEVRGSMGYGSLGEGPAERSAKRERAHPPRGTRRNASIAILALRSPRAPFK